MKNLLTKKLLVGSIMVGSVIVGDYEFRLTGWFGERHAKATKAKPAKVILETIGFANANTDLQACYDALLTRDPERDEGQVLFHLIFNPNGEVSFLEMVHSDFTEPEFVKCVTDRVRDVRGPASQRWSGQIIAHRFNFHRRDKTDMNFD